MAFTTWAAADLITAAKLNNDNTVAVGTDTARTITVTHTFTPTQTFTAGLTFGTSLSSTTALATPSAYTVTTGTLFASTVSGATLMGYGTTGDVTLKNRAGTDVIVVTSNTLNVTMAGALAITGALSGVTTLATSGLHSASGGVRILGDAGVVTGALGKRAVEGLFVMGIAGSTSDTTLATPGGSTWLSNPTGTTGALVAGGFGCNTKAAQTAYVSGGALAAYSAGTKGLDTDANVSALHALVVAIRAALVADGIMS